MAKLKLDVGTPIILDVVDYATVEGQFGEQIKFDAENGDVLYISKETADRQLGRLNYPTAPVRLHFEKVQKGSKTYVNIDLASGAKGNGTGGGATPRPAATTQPAAPPNPPAPANGEKQSALYARMTKWAMDDVVPLYVAQGIPVTMEGVAAIVATNFIEANKRAH